jgi:hypothetical protein
VQANVLSEQVQAALAPIPAPPVELQESYPKPLLISWLEDAPPGYVQSGAWLGPPSLPRDSAGRPVARRIGVSPYHFVGNQYKDAGAYRVAEKWQRDTFPQSLTMNPDSPYAQAITAQMSLIPRVEDALMATYPQQYIPGTHGNSVWQDIKETVTSIPWYVPLIGAAIFFAPAAIIAVGMTGAGVAAGGTVAAGAGGTAGAAGAATAAGAAGAVTAGGGVAAAAGGAAASGGFLTTLSAATATAAAGAAIAVGKDKLGLGPKAPATQPYNPGALQPYDPGGASVGTGPESVAGGFFEGRGPLVALGLGALGLVGLVALWRRRRR